MLSNCNSSLTEDFAIPPTSRRTLHARIIDKTTSKEDHHFFEFHRALKHHMWGSPFRVMLVSAGIWWYLLASGSICCYLLVSGGICWYLVVSGSVGIWWYLLASAGIWCNLVASASAGIKCYLLVSGSF